MSNSPDSKKEQVPESEATSANNGVGASAHDDGGGKNDGNAKRDGGAENDGMPVHLDEDSAYDDLFPDQEPKDSQPGQLVESKQDGSEPKQSEPPSQSNSTPQPVKPANSWPLVRKFEALIFMAMFAAVPLFAVRVIQYTHDQLIVRNVSKELVKDLQRAKTLAVKLQSEVEVSGSASKSAKLFSYVVLIREQVSEEVVLPERVSVVGSITFNKSGLPEKASSFIVSSENRTTTVEIDPTGLVSVPY